MKYHFQQFSVDPLCWDKLTHNRTVSRGGRMFGSGKLQSTNSKNMFDKRKLPENPTYL